VRIALARHCFLAEQWPITPWLFVRPDRVDFLRRRSAEIADWQRPRFVPRITALEEVQPWRYSSWNQNGDDSAQTTPDEVAEGNSVDGSLQVGKATLSEDASQFSALIEPIGKWLNETPSRVPLTDWYDSKTGLMLHFQARSVVGGVFIKALTDKNLREKWRKFSP
jgi:Domain of unknown function (DUF1793)